MGIRYPVLHWSPQPFSAKLSRAIRLENLIVSVTLNSLNWPKLTRSRVVNGRSDLWCDHNRGHWTDLDFGEAWRSERNKLKKKSLSHRIVSPHLTPDRNKRCCFCRSCCFVFFPCVCQHKEKGNLGWHAETTSLTALPVFTENVGHSGILDITTEIWLEPGGSSSVHLTAAAADSHSMVPALLCAFSVSTWRNWKASDEPRREAPLLAVEGRDVCVFCLHVITDCQPQIASLIKGSCVITRRLSTPCVVIWQ